VVAGKQVALDGTPDCTACKDLPCIDCSNGGDPEISPGYGSEIAQTNGTSSSEPPSVLFVCPNGKSACPGGENHVCGANRESSLCSECIDGYFKDVVYEEDVLTTTCFECGSTEVKGSTYLLFGLYVFAAAAMVLGLRHVRIVKSANIGFVQSGRIVISYFQIVSALGIVLELDLVKLVPAFGTILGFMQLLFFNVKDIAAGARCFGWPYFTMWFFKCAVIPCTPFVIILLYYRFLTRRRARDKKDVKTRITWVVFLLYPSVTHAIFELFQCRTLENSSWLKSDYSLSCESDEYRFYFRVAILLACLFTFGIPIILGTYFYLTLRANTKRFYELKSQQEEEEEQSLNRDDELTAPDAVTYNYEQLVGGFKGIVQDYKPQYFYFELVDFLRKFTFTAGLLFANQGSMFQLVTGSVLAMIFLFQHCVMWPFNKSVRAQRA